MYNIISKTKYAYIFSITLTVLSILSLIFWGLRFGIDFTGGTLMEIKFSGNPPGNVKIEEILKDANLQSLTVQKTGSDSAIIRYASESDAGATPSASPITA